MELAELCEEVSVMEISQKRGGRLPRGTGKDALDLYDGTAGHA